VPKFKVGYEYLQNGLAIRIAKKDMIIPNIEFKCAKEQLDFETLDNRLVVHLNDCRVYISPLEICIAYKFYLGSQKDIEDAVHLFCIFQDKINKKKIQSYLIQLGIDLEEVMAILRC